MNANKKILIDQPGFIGDIIFVMAIAQKYVNDGYVVDFPIFEEYVEVSLDKYFPNINFFPIKLYGTYKHYFGARMFEDEEYIFLPLRTCSNMKEKYDVLGFSCDMWHNIKINRNYVAEKELFDKLGLKEDDKYNLINEFHQRNFIKIPINVENEYKNVYMSKINGFTIFDWIGIMEKAQSIHTIGTALIFIIDSISTMPNDLHIYQRLDKGHNTYNYLLKKQYIYH